jgi:hypothetical protein
MDQQSVYKAETDFQEILRTPHRLFGYTYLYFLAVLAVIGILYVNNLNPVGNNRVLPVVLKDSSAFVLEIPYQSPGVLPPVDVRAASVPSDAMLTRGREVYRANCASCHGDNGQGDGPAGLVLNPKPRNFHSAEGWTNGAKISQIYRTLQDGIVRNGMASYAYLPPSDRFALIHLIRKFNPVPPMDSEPELMDLETVYQLSKGSVIAAQIPIREAERRVLAEHSGDVIAAAQRYKRFEESDDPAAALFARVTANPERALTALQSATSRTGTLDEFIRFVTPDPVQLGFRASVNQLDRESWEMLYQFVRRVML